MPSHMSTIKIRSLVCFFFCILCAQRASAFTLDARRVGMGGVFLGYHSDALQCNPAYLAVPSEKRPLSIPVPLGLLQLAGNFPVLDMNDPDFDPIYISNLLLNPPIHLQLITPEYTAAETDVTIDISEDHLQVDLGELQTFIPTDPVDSGIYDFRSPRVGKRFGRYSFTVAPFLIGEGKVTLSDNLIAALAEAEEFEPDSEYDIFVEGDFAAMASINASHGRRLPFDILGKDNPIFIGGTAKYLMGWAYIDTQNEFTILTNDPVFDDENPPEVKFTSVIRSSHPEWGTYSPSGTGYGFDLGILTKLDRMELGIGIQDIYSRITWEAEVERWTLNEESNEIVKETLVPFERYTQKIPRTFTISLAYRNEIAHNKSKQKEGYVIASNFDVIGGDVVLNLGSEFYMHSLPLRAGVFNEAGKIQLAFGVGLPAGPVNVDLGFATHNRTLSGAKGLYMATSLRFGEF